MHWKRAYLNKFLEKNTQMALKELANDGNLPSIDLEVIENLCVVNILKLCYGLIDMPESILQNGKMLEYFNKEELYVYELYEMVLAANNCLEAINYACKFVSEYQEQDYLKNETIPFDKFCLYHYDVICHKISTLKDLYLKIVNHIYELNINKNECSWKEIEGKKQQIGNPSLFDIFDDNFKLMKGLEKKRNASSHDGVIHSEKLCNIQLYLAMSSAQEHFSDIIPKNPIYDKSSKEYKAQIEIAHHDFFREIEIIRYNAIAITREFYNNVSEQLLHQLSVKIPINYQRAIQIHCDKCNE